MFLDEKLESSWNEFHDVILLFDILIDSIGNPLDIGTTAYLNGLKRVDGSWRLFAKRHQELREEAFKDFVCKCDTSRKVVTALGWQRR